MSTLKSLLKGLLLEHFPAIIDWKRAIQVRRHYNIFFQRKYQQGSLIEFQTRIKGKLFEGQDNIAVLSGPFRSMQYFNEKVWACPANKWIGSYEDELHEIIEKCISEGYRKIINIGAAEGYYAIGLALRIPSTAVFAFESDPWSRMQCKRLATHNRVQNVTVRGVCRHSELDQLAENALIICDIEGAELGLLDPALATNLRKADIIVEIHAADQRDPTTVEQIIMDRFRESHVIEVIETVSKNYDHYATVCQHSLTRRELEICLDEQRHGTMHWLWLKRPKPHPTAA